MPWPAVQDGPWDAPESQNLVARCIKVLESCKYDKVGYKPSMHMYMLHTVPPHAKHAACPHMHTPPPLTHTHTHIYTYTKSPPPHTHIDGWQVKEARDIAHTPPHTDGWQVKEAPNIAHTPHTHTEGWQVKETRNIAHTPHTRTDGWQVKETRNIAHTPPTHTDDWQVKEARDIAREALALMEDLVEFGKGGGSTAGWPAYINAKMKARGEGGGGVDGGYWVSGGGGGGV